METLKNVFYFISIGLAIGFTLIVYAHGNFSTKGTVQRIEQSQKERETLIIKRLDRIESKLDRLLYK